MKNVLVLLLIFTSMFAVQAKADFCNFVLGIFEDGDISLESLVRAQRYRYLEDLDKADQEGLMLTRKRAIAERLAKRMDHFNEWGAVKVTWESGREQTFVSTSREEERTILHVKAIYESREKIVDVKIYHIHPGHTEYSIPLSVKDFNTSLDIKLYLHNRFGNNPSVTIFALAADQTQYDHRRKIWTGPVSSFTW